MEFRTLVALAATMLCGAVAANATSAVQTAREQEPAPLPASFEDPAQAAPDPGFEIPEALIADAASIQIQLGSAHPDPRSASPLDLPVEVSPQ